MTASNEINVRIVLKPETQVETPCAYCLDEWGRPTFDGCETCIDSRLETLTLEQYVLRVLTDNAREILRDIIGQ